MPQVPTLQNQIRPQAAPDFQQRPLQRTVGQDLGQGVSNVGAVFSQIERQERDKANRAAVVDATSQLTDIETRLLYDPNNGAYTKKGKAAFDLPNQVLPEFDKQAGELLGGLKNDDQKFVFSERLKEQRSRLGRDLNQHEFQERESYYNEADASLLAASVDSAGRSSGQPDRVQAELATQRAVLDGTAKRLGWDEATKAGKLLDFETKTHESVIGGLLLKNDFEGAGRYLSQHAARMRDPAVETMQRRVLLEEEQQFQRSERERKRFGDEVTKSGDKLYAEGRLTAGWIESNRRFLDPEDYRYFYRKLTGKDGDGSSDPIAYSDLRDRAGRGEDVRTEAREALRRGQIQASDFDRILGEVESERSGWFKRGKEYISTVAAVSDLNPDPAAAQRKGAMINDWDDWAQANPRATDVEARQAAERIVSEYAIVDTSRLTLTKRAPTYLKGSRNAPDLDSTAKETVKAYEDGKIDRAEFERQAALIKDWENAMKFAPKPQKAPANGR